MFDNSPGTANPTNPSRRNMSLASASQGSSPEYLEELDRGESNPHAAKIATSNDSLVGGWALPWKIMEFGPVGMIFHDPNMIRKIPSGNLT